MYGSFGNIKTEPEFIYKFGFCFYIQCFFQAKGDKSIITGIISSLPISIFKVRSIFEKYEKSEKLLIGPTSAKPGPILFIQARTAVRLLSNPKSSIEINSVVIAIKTTYIAKYDVAA